MACQVGLHGVLQAREHALWAENVKQRRTPYRFQRPRLEGGQPKIAKQRIGALAAQLVAEGDSIALDIGSTTIEVAHKLAKRNLTILTPSLRIAGLFLNQTDARLIVPGGVVRTGEGSLVGELTRYAMERLFVDRLFPGRRLYRCRGRAV